MTFNLCFRLMLRKWWLVVATVTITCTVTAYLTFRQSPRYQATATYLVVPKAPEKATTVGVISHLLRFRSEIALTYTRVATSRNTRSRAAKALGLSQAMQNALSVQSKLRPGTMVITITARGRDPVVVSDFANQVGAETIEVARETYTIFALQPLDPAVVPHTPISPRKVRNMTWGGILGIVLGVGMAFLAVYLDVWPVAPSKVTVVG